MSSSSTPLPPDVAAVRKQRMNTDLISAFKRHVPPGTTPYVKGVGLYTHIEGFPSLETPLNPQPEFFPLCPLPPPGNQIQRSPLPPDIESLWEELCDVIQQEEQIVGQMELGLVELRKRYKGLDVPGGSHAPAREEGKRHATVANEKELSKHRSSDLVSSLTAGMQDVRMAVTEEHGRQLPKGTKIYGPDPRKLGR